MVDGLYGELENRKTTLSLSLFVYCFRFPLSADATVQQQQQLPLTNGTPPSHAETNKKIKINKHWKEKPCHNYMGSNLAEKTKKRIKSDL
jgi:hypothetical protein